MRHHISGAYKPTDFFETSAMLISFILLGKYLEAAAKSRTSAAITRLLQLTPPTAILLTLDAKGNVATEQELPTGLVHRGDLLKVGVAVLACFVMNKESCSQHFFVSGYHNQLMGEHEACLLLQQCLAFMAHVIVLCPSHSPVTEVISH